VRHKARPLKQGRASADWLRVAHVLPDPPDTLAGAPRTFYDELRKMLAVVGPTQLNSARTEVVFDHGGLRVELPHATHEHWSVWAMVDARHGIAGADSVHEHFEAGTDEQRPWTTQIVDFLAELLRGEIEIETTFRGDAITAVRHYNHDESGERSLLGSTAFLSPGRFLFWRPQRVETQRVTFV
jgi:hypothetical protein